MGNYIHSYIAAAANDNVEKIESKLKKHPDLLDAFVGIDDDNDVLTNLAVAARHNSTHVVACLLAKGADANIVNTGGKSAIMYAAMKGCTESLVLLLEKGDADINTTDVMGRTALMHAAINSHLDCVLALLERGADVHIVCRKNGNTACSYASDDSIKQAITDFIVDSKINFSVSTTSNITADGGGAGGAVLNDEGEV
mmetsp:Transcript_15706/g.26180  ORF Transcript_15706/g.26180 Transcript_15706/m.26180 type:complete len:198 (+) Transcript_15706:81-674(+)